MKREKEIKLKKSRTYIEWLIKVDAPRVLQSLMISLGLLFEFLPLCATSISLSRNQAPVIISDIPSLLIEGCLSIIQEKLNQHDLSDPGLKSIKKSIKLKR